jgi:hypothetical protein
LICHFRGAKGGATMLAIWDTCWLRRRVIPLALLALILTGCSKPAVFHASDEGSGDRTVPFHAAGAPPDGPGASQDQQTSQDAENGVPFGNSAATLPAGTLLAVRLDKGLSSSKVDGGFSAILEAPVLVEGRTVVPRGTSVRGRVESARASEVKKDTGYLRLTLDSILITGKEVPVQTSSLFARGIAGEAPEASANSSGATEISPRIIQLTKGRRLTFRLTAAVSLRGNGPALKAENPPPSYE